MIDMTKTVTSSTHTDSTATKIGSLDGSKVESEETKSPISTTTITAGSNIPNPTKLKLREAETTTNQASESKLAELPAKVRGKYPSTPNLKEFINQDFFIRNRVNTSLCRFAREVLLGEGAKGKTGQELAEFNRMREFAVEVFCRCYYSGTRGSVVSMGTAAAEGSLKETEQEFGDLFTHENEGKDKKKKRNNNKEKVREETNSNTDSLTSREKASVRVPPTPETIETISEEKEIEEE
ncbi:MAG: hypothetical protein LBB18_02010, partial [Puniceicoccales bacterium]|nr:hypothetical protein [Puniceicoccales bacterium]